MTDTPEQRAALDALLHQGAEEMRARADRIDPWSCPGPEAVAIAIKLRNEYEKFGGLISLVASAIIAAKQQARRAALEEAVKALNDEANKYLANGDETDKDIGHSLKFASAIVQMLYEHPLSMLEKHSPTLIHQEPVRAEGS